MQLLNKTQQTVLSESVIIPKSILDQSLGLLRYSTPVAMVLHTRFGIHTFGMKYSIDVVVLNQNNRVVTLKTNLQPNKIFVWDIKYTTVIELKEGILNKTKTKIGDEILLVTKNKTLL